ncbi:Uncharacterised protein [Moraxella caprae]|uniref:Uncharacterized protein n=2 Tax=Moraxella caprae TaxID=90240 RepID=A0A378R4Q0_9GAMM|nr:Uncharacterised protein [Moraxella caprae]
MSGFGGGSLLVALIPTALEAVLAEATYAKLVEGIIAKNLARAGLFNGAVGGYLWWNVPSSHGASCV